MQKKENLVKARMRAGLTIPRAADVLGIDESEYRRYENSTSEPSLEILCKIADAFDVSTDFLLERTNIPSVAQSETPIYDETHYALLHKYGMLREDDKSRIAALINSYLSN